MLRQITKLQGSIARNFSASTTSFSEAQPKPPTKEELDELFADKSKQQRNYGFSKNRVEIVGGVGYDPVLRTGKNNRHFAIIPVVTNHITKLANGEEKKNVEVHNISVFGPQAEDAVKNIKKGTRVAVEARLHYTGGKVDENGERSLRQMYIHAFNIQILPRYGPSQQE